MYPTANAGNVIRGGNGGVHDAKSAVERGSVPVSLEEQERALNGLHNTINDLEQRLCGVLGPSGPTAANTAPATPPGTIMQRVDQHNRQILIAQSRIAELMSRLEL